jgi:hypothetical protein
MTHQETKMTGTRVGSAGLLAILAAWVLASCITVSGNAEPRRADCHNDDDCKVTVSIVNCGHFTCEASVDPDELNVRGNNARWELTKEALDAGFEFQPTYGVWFKTLDGQDAFECKRDGKMYKCKTKVQAPAGKRYRYGVQIIGPKSVALLDPWIVN